MLKLLPALAFIPEEDVLNAFRKLTNSVCFPDETLPVLEYFEKTYIGRPEHCKPPLFSLTIWNCFKSVASNLPKTNNNVEGWHRGFSTTIGREPNMWKFIVAIQLENSQNMMIIDQVRGGADGPYKRRKYKSADEKLKRIMSNYNVDIDVVGYLQGIASTFSY